MIRFNARFVPYLRVPDIPRRSIMLPRKLAQVADRGFMPKDDCYVLAARATMRTNVTRDTFPDRTGYECFFNNIHLDDDAPTDPEAVEIGFLFARRVFEVWAHQAHDGVLRMILSVDPTAEFRNVTTWFHQERTGERWLVDDLETYDQAVFEMLSCDVASLASLLGTQ